MSTIRLVRDFVCQVPIESLFTSRDLLKLGTRKRVDDCVYDLVRSGEIVRVSRGVFHRPERKKAVGILELAIVKAKSFGREIIEHASDVAKDLGLTNEPSSENEYRFSIGGRSSSFRFGSMTIHFKGTSLRNMALGDSACGKVIRALCFVGKEQMATQIIETAISTLNQSEKEELVQLCASMPAWLSDLLCHCYQQVKSRAPAPAISSVTLYSPDSNPVEESSTSRNFVSEMKNNWTNVIAFLHKEQRLLYKTSALALKDKFA